MPYTRIQAFKPNPFQDKMIRSAMRAPLVVATTAQGSGKTGGLCAVHRFKAKYNPGVLGFAVVESFKWYRRVMHRTAVELFGHEAHYHGSDYTWTWKNRAQFMVLSYDQIDSWEGPSGGWATIDEYQNLGIDAYEVISSRLRDVRMVDDGSEPGRNTSVVVAGLMEFDSWADSLAERIPGAVHLTNIGTDVNASNMRAGYTESLKHILSPEEYARRVLGQKPFPVGRVFRDFLAQENGGNLVRHTYNPAWKTYMGCDFGRKAAIVFAQEPPGTDDLIYFYELNPDDTSTEIWSRDLLDIAVPRNLAKAGDRRILVDETICDPAGNNWQSAEAARDIETLRAIFGGNVRFTYDRKLRSIRYGIELVKGMVLNAAGRRRLFVDSEMWYRGIQVGHKGRSLAMSFVRTKYPEDRIGRPVSEEPVKDGLDDHTLDAARYIVTNKRGRPESGSVPIR